MNLTILIDGLSPTARLTLEQLEIEQPFTRLELITRLLDHTLCEIDRDRKAIAEHEHGRFQTAADTLIDQANAQS